MRSSVVSKIAITIFILLASSLFLLPSVVAVSYNSTALPSAITKDTTSGNAGYGVYAPSPGGNIAVSSTWTVPTVTFTLAESHSLVRFDIDVYHIYTAPDAGSDLEVGSIGLNTPVYFIYYFLRGSLTQLPAVYSVSPGDKMQTIASVATSTGAVSITINDLTQGWTFASSSTEPVNTKASGEVNLVLFGTPSSLPMFTTLKTRADIIELGTHHGNIGSFLSIPSDTVTEYIKENSAGTHVLAKPSSITSSSSSFSIRWIRSS